MSADTSQVYVRSAQRRFLRIALAVAAVILLVAVPLIINGSLRLDLAYRFNLAPGEDVERVASEDSGMTLVVIPIFVKVNESRDEARYHAAFLAKSLGDRFEFTNLDNGSVIDVPVRQLDFLSADRTGEHLLITEGNGAGTKRLLLTVATGAFEQLPADQAEPDLPGDWTTSIFATRIGRTCLGISPTQAYIACFKSPTFATFLAGDWQIDVQKYGQYRTNMEILRGEGTQPVFGFAANDTWLYIQNETGIWREPMNAGMFPS